MPPARCRFNPRARDGRDQMLPTLTTLASVSIHAPVTGATENIEGFTYRINLFQSTRP